MSVSSFGAGYVDDTLQNNRSCTGTLRISWEGDRKPQIAWTTTHGSSDNEKVWTYDETVSMVNDDANPFFAHSSPASAFSSKGWLATPPSTFTTEEGDHWIELRGTPMLYNGPTQTVVVQAGIAQNEADGEEGTAWSARYYCLEDGLSTP